VLSRRAGDALPLAVGESVKLDPQSPWKKAVPASSSPAVARDVFDPLTNGFYEMETRNGTHWLAVNTFNEGESDLRGAAPAAGTNLSLPEISLARVADWPLWQYLAAAALLLFALEWWLFHRRRTE
jgi:hypothetical protein